jgi:hypothetical protein
MPVLRDISARSLLLSQVEIPMNFDSRLYVEIHPFEGAPSPHPHPVDDGHFDPHFVYKVLGIYNPSETSECYFMLANPERQIWFIPQRHLLAQRLIESDELFLPKGSAACRCEGRTADAHHEVNG